MRIDVKELIESRDSWQKLHPVEDIQIQEVLPAQEAIQKWRKKDPIMVELFSHWIKSHRAGNTAEVETAKQAIEYHKKSVLKQKV